MVTTVGSGSVVTLTASVSSGSTALTTGQINFCDASAKHCTDVHLLGMAQLTSKGIAVLKFRPGIGSGSYRAVFLGTTKYATSSSAASSLSVTGLRASTTTITPSGNPGNYTLTATVAGIVNNPNVPTPTGLVSFVDITTNNAILGTAALGSSGVVGLTFPNFSSPSVTQQGNAVAAADFNGDGIQDLAVSDSNDGQVLLAILLGNGDGSFTATTASPTVGLYPDSIAVGDFNSDGIPDLAVTSVDQNIVTVLLGNGDGSFSANVPNLNTGGTPQSVAVGDFNGDGIPDLAVVNANSVLIFLGNGDGTFSQTPTSPSTGTGPINVAVGDFNSDGNADMAVTNSVSGTVTILLGKGDGTFQEMPQSPVIGGSPDGLAIADFNGDGIPDIAVTNYSGNNNAVMVLLGNGDGTFQTATANSAPGLNFHSVVVADFNGDGIPDLAAGEFWHGLLAVLLGKGDGTFAAAMAVDAQSQLGSGYLAAADFNGDGISDLAVPNQGGTVPILLTQPTLSVTASIGGISPTGPSPQEVNASYPGDTNYKSSVSGTTTLTILAATPSISPSSGTYGSPQTITITDSTTSATIYYSESGLIQTSGYLQYSGPITLSGIGSESIMAYAVAPQYAQSLTASAMYTLAQDFTFNAPTGTSTSATIQPGGQATYSLALTPPTGTTTAATTTFSVTGLPNGATATFSPTSVPVNSGPTTVTLTISVPGAMGALNGANSFDAGMMLGAMGLILLPFSGRARSMAFRMKPLLLLGLAAVVLAEFGCSGNKQAAGQTYSLTVTAKSGSLSHSASLILTVD
ncbi:MAG TPA: FG-GAP-like repeat-containing protein [Candidatus Binatus sp.]|nr:FG-GAP-like repeat-containing protein [Candidatus Binatus sp.]